jgi:hypothetical protein
MVVSLEYLLLWGHGTLVPQMANIIFLSLNSCLLSIVHLSPSKYVCAVFIIGRQGAESLHEQTWMNILVIIQLLFINNIYQKADCSYCV